jgi:predicted nucleic-acid-binding Zn-ribbon protein
MGLFKRREVEPVEVCGRAFRCLACGHDRFWQRKAQLNTWAATFLNLDWANRSAICIVCSECGYIHWFMPQ